MCWGYFWQNINIVTAQSVKKRWPAQQPPKSEASCSFDDNPQPFIHNRNLNSYFLSSCYLVSILFETLKKGMWHHDQLLTFSFCSAIWNSNKLINHYLGTKKPILQSEVMSPWHVIVRATGENSTI